MKLPRRIHIGPFRYVLRVFKRGHAELKSRNGANCLGTIDYDRGAIAIEAGQVPTTEAHTLLHEVVHGILVASELTRENSSEKLVNGLATLLLQVLLDSPGLLEYLDGIKKERR
jgi:hypothetical protein